MILIDSNSGDDKLSFKLMENADLIVVNLTQHRYVLDKFFNDYGDRFLENEKVFYLFGDYDDNSSYNINNFRRKYRKFIHQKNSGVIPYCTKYLDAQNDSEVIKFMKDGLNLNCNRNNQQYFYLAKKTLQSGKYVREETDYMFHRSRLAVEKMLELLHVPIKQYGR
jgi:cellulose biosynthesis protein BcsQ